MTRPQASVNGVEIQQADIAAEAQNHPAPTPGEALEAAARALVIRELLLQRARTLGIKPSPERVEANRRETDEESMVRQVLDAEVKTPDADEETCRHYYENNRKRFSSPTLYEAAHILFAARKADAEAYELAVGRAEGAISRLLAKPGEFADLARELSDCPSGRNGGSLGQVTRGDTVPEVETFLENLEDGQICPVPVKSRYGAHVLRLDRRIEGRQLPFEVVHDRIAEYLAEASWRRAVTQYVRILAGQSDIKGVDFAGSDTPLVQ